MFEKFSRSWELVKASAAVLRSDRELMLFPVISTIATLVVLATFALPTFAWRVFDGGFGATAMAWVFLFYFCQYSVIIFFNCALVGAAMIRLEGGDPTLRDGFNVAWSRLVPILGYAAIAATVGVLLQSLKNRDNNFLVRLVGGGLGAIWTLATFMVVPVLVSQDIGPVDALKQLVPVAQQVEQHHRHQQQVDEDGEQHLAADLERAEQLPRQVLVFGEKFPRQLLRQVDVELYLEIEPRRQPGRGMLVEPGDESRQFFHQQAGFLVEHRQHHQHQPDQHRQRQQQHQDHRDAARHMSLDVVWIG